MSQFQLYQRIGQLLARDLTEDEACPEDLQNKGITVSEEAVKSWFSTPAGKVCKHIDNPADQWYVPQDVFEKSYRLATA